MTFVIIDRKFLARCLPSKRSEYIESIYNILVQCNPPYTFVESIYGEIHCPFLIDHEIKQILQYFNSDSPNFTPQNRIKNLSDVKTPIDLYIFSQNFHEEMYSIEECQQMLNNVPIRNVKLYFIGKPSKINFHFIFIFQKFSQDIYINFQYKGHISPNFDFKDIDYAFLMKDDSIKLQILLKLFSNNTDRNELRETLYQSYLRISKKKLINDKIYPFYIGNNVQDCVQFIQKHSDDLIQIQFRSRMYNIIQLLQFSLEDLKGFVLENDKIYRYNIHSKIECELIPIDILYTNNETIVFPFQLQEFRLFKELGILSCFSFIEIIAEITDSALYITKFFSPESYESFKEIYNKDPTGNEELLQNVYILNNGILPFQTVIKHNNAILSRFYPYMMKTNENIILWHMAFLYILGMKKLPEMRDRLFQEIRLLGDSTEYFISLHEHVDPLILDKINAGFWYIAKIFDLAFPTYSSYRFNEYKLYLLDFYKNVYDPNYTYPPDMILNHLQNEFDKQYGIFNVLSHFYEYDYWLFDYPHNRLSGIILYNKLLPKNLRSCLSSVNLEIILKQYQLKRRIKKNKIKQLNIIHDSSKLQFDCVQPTDRFFASTYCSYRIFGIESLGFNLDVDDYLKIFKAYCVKTKKYPRYSMQLLSFLSLYYFHETGMPVLFEPAVKDALEKTIFIFSNVMNKMGVWEYISWCQKKTHLNSNEELPDLE